MSSIIIIIIIILFIYFENRAVCELICEGRLL